MSRTRFALRPDGFSLLEMVVTLTLFSLITVIVFAAFDLSVRTINRGGKRIEETERVRSVFQLIRRQIASIYPVVPEEEESEDEPPAEGVPRGRVIQLPYFLGSGERMAFISLFSLRLNAIPGLCFVAYAVEPADDGPGMVLVEYEKQYTGVNPMGRREGSPLPENIFRYELLGGLESAGFEYYGVDPDAPIPTARQLQPPEKRWHPAWDVEQRGDLPEAVRLTYRFLPGTRSGMAEGEVLVPIRSHGNTLRPALPFRGTTRGRN